MSDEALQKAYSPRAEAELARRRGKDDLGAQLDRIADRYHPGEGERGLHEFGDQELMQMLLTGDHETALAAVYELIRAHEGKALRWTQLEAPIALLDGQHIQMDAGEGKSLALLAATARKATEGAAQGAGKWVQLITTRDALADRELEVFTEVFGDHGIDVVRMSPDGVSQPLHKGKPTILIGTHEDAAFSDLSGKPTPGHWAIVDEGDDAFYYTNSTFIRQEGAQLAATPEDAAAVLAAHDFLHGLLRDGALDDAHFGRERGQRGGPARLDEAGRKVLSQRLGRPLTAEESQRFDMAATARFEYAENTHYVVDSVHGRVLIIDQVTGKVMFDPRTSSESRWNGGLAQALEAKHGLRIRADADAPKQTSMGELFGSVGGERRFENVVTASGTNKGKEEIYRELGLSDRIAAIERYHQLRLTVGTDKVFATEAEKHLQIARDIAEMRETGRPQYVVALRNDEAATISRLLTKTGVEHTHVDAKWWVDKANQGADAMAEFQQIVKDAGDTGKVTIVTMAGARGLDPGQGDQGLGGLMVRATARSAISPDLDIQLQNRAGRSGEQGAVQFYLSPDDQLFALSHNEHVRAVTVQYVESTRSHTETTAASRATAADGLRAVVPFAQHDAQNRTLEQFRHQLLQRRHDLANHAAAAAAVPGSAEQRAHEQAVRDIVHAMNSAGATAQTQPGPAHDTQADDGTAANHRHAAGPEPDRAADNGRPAGRHARRTVIGPVAEEPAAEHHASDAADGRATADGAASDRATSDVAAHPGHYGARPAHATTAHAAEPRAAPAPSQHTEVAAAAAANRGGPTAALDRAATGGPSQVAAKHGSRDDYRGAYSPARAQRDPLRQLRERAGEEAAALPSDAPQRVREALAEYRRAVDDLRRHNRQARAAEAADLGADRPGAPAMLAFTNLVAAIRAVSAAAARYAATARAHGLESTLDREGDLLDPERANTDAARRDRAGRFTLLTRARIAAGHPHPAAGLVRRAFLTTPLTETGADTVGSATRRRLQPMIEDPNRPAVLDRHGTRPETWRPFVFPELTQTALDMLFVHENAHARNAAPGRGVGQAVRPSPGTLAWKLRSLTAAQQEEAACEIAEYAYCARVAREARRRAIDLAAALPAPALRLLSRGYREVTRRATAAHSRPRSHRRGKGDPFVWETLHELRGAAAAPAERQPPSTARSPFTPDAGVLAGLDAAQRARLTAAFLDVGRDAAALVRRIVAELPPDTLTGPPARVNDALHRLQIAVPHLSAEHAALLTTDDLRLVNELRAGIDVPMTLLERHHDGPYHALRSALDALAASVAAAHQQPDEPARSDVAPAPQEGVLAGPRAVAAELLARLDSGAHLFELGPQLETLRILLAAVVASDDAPERLRGLLAALTDIRADLAAVAEAAPTPALHAVARDVLHSALFALCDPGLRPAPMPTGAAADVTRADGAESGAAVAALARSVADRATGLATAPGSHVELASSVAAAAGRLAGRPVDATRAAAVDARLRGLQQLLTQLGAALVASPSDETVLARRRDDLQQALHQLNLASGRYEQLRVRAEHAVSAGRREAQRWARQLLLTTMEHADPVVVAYRHAAYVQRLSDELAGFLADGEPAAAGVIEPLVAALDGLAAAADALAAGSPPVGPDPALSAGLIDLLTEAAQAVSFAQRERAWRQSCIVHSATDLDELGRIASQRVRAAPSAALVAAQLDALYLRVDAARRGLTERADLDSLADGQALVTPAELALLERVIPAGLLAEMVTALGRYRYRRDHGLLELGHLGGQDPLSQTLLASRDNVRALRRRIEELSNELAGARRRGTPTAILRYRLNLLLDSHNAQLPVLVRDIDSELETVRRKRDVFAAAGNRAAVERLQWWRSSLMEERGRALARIAAVRRNEKRLKAARRQNTTAAGVLYTSYRDLVGIEEFLRGLDAAQMAPSPGLFGLDRHLAGLLEPFGDDQTAKHADALSTRTGLPADVIVDVSTDTQSVDDLRRAYVALHRSQDEQQASFDDPARRAALDADLDPTRRVIDGVNLIAAFQSAYEQCRETVDAALAEAEGPVSAARLVELAAVVREEMARARFLAWLWQRGADRLWAPADDRQARASLVALANESLSDLGCDVRADVVAAMQVCDYLTENGLELTGVRGAPALHDMLRGADSDRGSDLALPRLRELVVRRLKGLKRTSPVEIAANPELRMISHELAKAMSDRSGHQAYLSRLGGGEQAAAALKAIEDGLASRLVPARRALAHAEAAGAPEVDLRQRRADLRLLARRLAGVLLRRLRLLATELRQIRDDGLLPDDVAGATLDRELRRATRLDQSLTDVDVVERPLWVLFETVQRLDGLWLRCSRGWRSVRDERVAQAAAKTAAPNLERVVHELGRLARAQPGYCAALRSRMAQPARDLLAVSAEWDRAQRQRRTYLVQLSELARDVGLLLHGLHQPDAPQARQEMLRERIGRRQEALALWTLRGPSAQPIPPDPTEVATTLPAPARHLPGSDPLMGAGVLSPELGINPFEWPGVVVGVNARVVSAWEPLTYDVRRTSFPNVIGGPLMVTVSASRDWQIDYHGATLRVRETRRSTTILEGPLMMGRAGAAVSPGSFGTDVFGSPIDLPGAYPDNQNQPPGAPPHVGALPTAVPIPLRLHGHEVGGVLAHVVLRAPYLAWETSFLPTNFHQFDHVDAVNLVVVKQRGDNGGDPLPDLPDRWVVQAPAVDIASTGSPRHRLDLQTKAGVGFDTLWLLQFYAGDSTQGLDTIMTLATVGAVLQAQITTEPKFSVEGTDVGLGVEWLWATFVSAGIGIKSLPYVLVPELLPAGFWSAIGGVGVSGVPFNHVRGRSLMPLVRFLRGRMLRRMGAAQRRLFYDWMRQCQQAGTGGGRVGDIARRGGEWIPIIGPVLRTARTAATHAQARLAVDTAATMTLAELRTQAIQERLAGAASRSGSVSDNARRLIRHIEASGLLGADGSAGRAAAAARAVANSALGELPDGVRGLRTSVADQLAQLRQDFDRLAVAHTFGDDTAAAVQAAAERLQVQTARGAAARAIERGVDAVLNLERALPAVPATADLAELNERIASWARAATERLLDAAGAVDEPDAFASAAMVRLPGAAAAVAARLEHLAELIARAAGPAPHRRALRWALAAGQLRRAVFDIEPLRELDRLLARSEPAPPPPSASPSAPPSAAPPSGPAQLPALRAAVRKPDFQLAMSVTAAALTDAAIAAHIVREAAAVTTQDALAWSTVRPDETHVVLDELDAVLAFAAAHDLPVHAHAVISPDDLPSWLLTGDHTPAETTALMRDHVTRLVGAYRGRVRRWTVVDQPLSDTGALRDSLWRVRVGRQYVADAFRAAAAADPSAVLYLTDHDVAGENPDKTEQFFQLVSALRREGAPLHGVGVRLRLAVRRGPDGVPFVDWTPAAVRVNLRRLAAMGLEVAIAGLDVRLPARPSATDQAVQAQAYAEVVRISQEIDGVRSLTLWGVSDGPGTGSATPFRADRTPKPAVAAMLAALRNPATSLPGKGSARTEGAGTFEDPIRNVVIEADPIGSAPTASGGVGVRRARIPGVDGPVVVKQFPDTPPNRQLIETEMTVGRIASDAGIGAPIYGVVAIPDTPTGTPVVGFAMGDAPGGSVGVAGDAYLTETFGPAAAAEAVANAANINDRTFTDVAAFRDALTAAGWASLGDIQGFVGRDGRWRPVGLAAYSAGRDITREVAEARLGRSDLPDPQLIAAMNERRFGQYLDFLRRAQAAAAPDAKRGDRDDYLVPESGDPLQLLRELTMDELLVFLPDDSSAEIEASLDACVDARAKVARLDAAAADPIAALHRAAAPGTEVPAEFSELVEAIRELSTANERYAAAKQRAGVTGGSATIAGGLLDPVRSGRDQVALTSDGMRFAGLALARTVARLKLDPGQQLQLLRAVPNSELGIRGLDLSAAGRRRLQALVDDPYRSAFQDPRTGRMFLPPGVSQTAFDGHAKHELAHAGALPTDVARFLADEFPGLRPAQRGDAWALINERETYLLVVAAAQRLGYDVDPAELVPEPEHALIEAWEQARVEVERRARGELPPASRPVRRLLRLATRDLATGQLPNWPEEVSAAFVAYHQALAGVDDAVAAARSPVAGYARAGVPGAPAPEQFAELVRRLNALPALHGRLVEAAAAHGCDTLLAAAPDPVDAAMRDHKVRVDPRSGWLDVLWLAIIRAYLERRAEAHPELRVVLWLDDADGLGPLLSAMPWPLGRAAAASVHPFEQRRLLVLRSEVEARTVRDRSGRRIYLQERQPLAQFAGGVIRELAVRRLRVDPDAAPGDYIGGREYTGGRAVDDLPRDAQIYAAGEWAVRHYLTDLPDPVATALAVQDAWLLQDGAAAEIARRAADWARPGDPARRAAVQDVRDVLSEITSLQATQPVDAEAADDAEDAFFALVNAVTTLLAMDGSARTTAAALRAIELPPGADASALRHALAVALVESVLTDRRLTAERLRSNAWHSRPLDAVRPNVDWATDPLADAAALIYSADGELPEHAPDVAAGAHAAGTFWDDVLAALPFDAQRRDRPSAGAADVSSGPDRVEEDPGDHDVYSGYSYLQLAAVVPPSFERWRRSWVARQASGAAAPMDAVLPERAYYAYARLEALEAVLPPDPTALPASVERTERAWASFVARRLVELGHAEMTEIAQLDRSLRPAEVTAVRQYAAGLGRELAADAHTRLFTGLLIRGVGTDEHDRFPRERGLRDHADARRRFYESRLTEPYPPFGPDDPWPAGTPRTAPVTVVPATGEELRRRWELVTGVAPDSDTIQEQLDHAEALAAERRARVRTVDALAQRFGGRLPDWVSAERELRRLRTAVAELRRDAQGRREQYEVVKDAHPEAVGVDPDRLRVVADLNDFYVGRFEQRIDALISLLANLTAATVGERELLRAAMADLAGGAEWVSVNPGARTDRTTAHARVQRALTVRLRRLQAERAEKQKWLGPLDREIQDAVRKRTALGPDLDAESTDFDVRNGQWYDPDRLGPAQTEYLELTELLDYLGHRKFDLERLVQELEAAVAAEADRVERITQLLHLDDHDAAPSAEELGQVRELLAGPLRERMRVLDDELARLRRRDDAAAAAARAAADAQDVLDAARDSLGPLTHGDPVFAAWVKKHDQFTYRNSLANIARGEIAALRGEITAEEKRLDRIAAQLHLDDPAWWTAPEPDAAVAPGGIIAAAAWQRALIEDLTAGELFPDAARFGPALNWLWRHLEPGRADNCAQNCLAHVLTRYGEPTAPGRRTVDTIDLDAGIIPRLGGQHGGPAEIEDRVHATFAALVPERRDGAPAADAGIAAALDQLEAQLVAAGHGATGVLTLIGAGRDGAHMIVVEYNDDGAADPHGRNGITYWDHDTRGGRLRGRPDTEGLGALDGLALDPSRREITLTDPDGTPLGPGLTSQRSGTQGVPPPAGNSDGPAYPRHLDGAGTFEDPIRNVVTEPDPIGSAGDFGSEVALGDAYGARRAHLPGIASPIVVKQYPDEPGVRRLIEADIAVGRIAWAAGVGVPVYGVVALPEASDGTSVIGFAMGEAPGGFFEESCGDYGPAAAREASANARNITDQTYVDIATFRDALTERGYEVGFDIQGFVAPDGRWRPIDFAARPNPARTPARIAAHNEWVFDQYLAEVRAAQAAVDSGIFGGHVIDPPASAPQLRNVVQAAAGVRRLGAGVPGVSAIEPGAPGRLLVTTEHGRCFYVEVEDDPGSMPAHLHELFADERGRPYAIAAIAAGRIAERAARENAVDTLAGVDAALADIAAIHAGLSAAAEAGVPVPAATLDQIDTALALTRAARHDEPGVRPGAPVAPLADARRAAQRAGRECRSAASAAQGDAALAGQLGAAADGLHALAGAIAPLVTAPVLDQSGSTLSPLAVTDHAVMAQAQILGWVHEAHLGATKRAAFTALVALLQLPDDVVDRVVQLDRLALFGYQELANLVWQAITGSRTPDEPPAKAEGAGTFEDPIHRIERDSGDSRRSDTDDPIRPAGRPRRPVRLVPDAMVAQVLAARVRQLRELTDGVPLDSATAAAIAQYTEQVLADRASRVSLEAELTHHLDGALGQLAHAMDHQLDGLADRRELNDEFLWKSTSAKKAKRIGIELRANAAQRERDAHNVRWWQSAVADELDAVRGARRALSGQLWRWANPHATPAARPGGTVPAPALQQQLLTELAVTPFSDPEAPGAAWGRLVRMLRDIDPGQQINCVSQAIAWVLARHGQRPIAPDARTLDGYVVDPKDDLTSGAAARVAALRPLGGEVDGPRRLESTLGGQVEQLVAKSWRRRASSATLRAGWDRLEKHLAEVAVRSQDAHGDRRATAVATLIRPDGTAHLVVIEYNHGPGVEEHWRGISYYDLDADWEASARLDGPPSRVTHGPLAAVDVLVLDRNMHAATMPDSRPGLSSPGGPVAQYGVRGQARFRRAHPEIRPAGAPGRWSSRTESVLAGERSDGRYRRHNPGR